MIVIFPVGSVRGLAGSFCPLRASEQRKSGPINAQDMPGFLADQPNMATSWVNSLRRVSLTVSLNQGEESNPAVPYLLSTMNLI